MTGFTGTSVHRVEDQRLLTGSGQFVEDIQLPDTAHAVVLRSPIAHGRITCLDIKNAMDMPGVLAIYTGDDLERLGCHPMPCVTAHPSSDGTPFQAPIRPLLAQDRVRFAGDPVAFIVADSEAIAIAAMELIMVDYEEEDAITEPTQSQDIACIWEEGDKAAVDHAFAGAARVVEIAQRSNRIAVSPIETRSALGTFLDGQYTLHTQSQGVHFMRDMMATTLGANPASIRVITADVGGSFGIKLMNYPEQSLVLAAAREVGRPIRWVSSRSEAFLTDAYGRGQVSTAKLALNSEGRILALSVDSIGDMGAYASALGISVLTKGFGKTLGHVYDIPMLHYRVKAVYTNAAPTDAYRGAGKPEAQYLVERLIDKASTETGLGAIAFRQKNLIPPSKMPYKAANGFPYDSAHFEQAMMAGVKAADWDSFPQRRAASEAKGLKRGIGVGVYLHLTGGSPKEKSEVLLQKDGSIQILTGVQASGQGHQTAFAQMVADRLQIPMERIEVVEGDTAQVKTGGGTGGSSSLPIAGVTIMKATDALIDLAKAQAAEQLETAIGDIEYGNGGFTVVGTDKRISLVELAAAQPPESEKLCGMADSDHAIQTVPHGAYIAEVEVDPETGHVALVALTAADDLGRRVNPMIAEGQIHGGLAQAIGQAMFERTIFDPDTGQLLSGSFMDYQLPRAGDLPNFDLHDVDIPTDNNILGMKGVGENASIGGPAAVINAIADALGTQDIDMPMTPERVWRTLNSL
jgi:aerobic carbon-monoxide dehydrogenase large subunit